MPNNPMIRSGCGRRSATGCSRIFAAIQGSVMRPSGLQEVCRAAARRQFAANDLKPRAKAANRNPYFWPCASDVARFRPSHKLSAGRTLDYYLTYTSRTDPADLEPHCGRTLSRCPDDRPCGFRCATRHSFAALRMIALPRFSCVESRRVTTGRA